MSELIYQDENGAEIRRVAKGKGRPPRGAVKQPDGNFIVKPTNTVSNRFVPHYVTLDAAGVEVAREPRGRGRGRPGYTKHETGPFAGHWVGQPVVTAPETNTETPAVAEPTATATA